MAVNTAGSTISLATLYVGDLDPDITEAQLFERFSAAGPVLSIRVCRDQITKQSLGYAYVNFQQPADAERALDTMNFDLLSTRPMRIMWSQRDPALRKNGVGNVFIKNLDKSIDNKALYDTFSTFGNILSCKIMIDETGNSKGYGFVHFETQEAADKAIDSVNNMLLNNKKVFVGQFLSKNQRNDAEGGPYRKFTNVFVKNFADQLDDDRLREMFEKYGDITSAVIARDYEGKSKGFGFVNFKETHCAEAAVKEMNEQVIGDKKLLVGAFQKKTERLSDLKKKYEDEKRERLSKYSGVNLYIKNLDDKVDDDKLRKEFEPFGTITSAKVMTEGGRSKGFGFVCFSAPEEATRAVTEMNSRIVGSKPLYVALAQRKEERKNHLTNQYMQRISNMRMQNQQLLTGQSGSGGYPQQNPGMAAANMFMPQLSAQNARLYSTPLYAQHQQQQQIRPTPRWAGPQRPQQQPQANGGGQPQYQAYQMLGQNQGQRTRMPMGQGQQQNPAAAAAAAQAQAAAQAMIRPNNSAHAAAAAAQAQARLNYNPMAYAQQMQQRNMAAAGQQQLPQQQQMQQRQQPSVQQQPKMQYRTQQQQGSINVPGQEPLTTDMLAAAQPQEQKQLLGERLYPLIQNMHPDWAGKITGMLLEIDNAELLHMLDSRESLKEKVDEAVAVLMNHQSKAQTAEQ